jgi:hypothetical protein
MVLVDTPWSRVRKLRAIHANLTAQPLTDRHHLGFVPRIQAYLAPRDGDIYGGRLAYVMRQLGLEPPPYENR